MRNHRMHVLSLAIIAASLTAGVAQAQKLPASTTIGTNPAGSLFYSVASGLAKVISEAGPMQSAVQPYTGSSTFLPLLDNGELDFGIINAVDMGLAYQGQRLEDRRAQSHASHAAHAFDHARFTAADQHGLAQRRSGENRLRRQRQTRDR